MKDVLLAVGTVELKEFCSVDHWVVSMVVHSVELLVDAKAAL